MEAIGAGASVLAFLGFGIQCAQIICSVLSPIEDAPRNVSQAARDVANLRSVLEQLSACRALNVPADDALREHVRTCADDLGKFAAELQKLTISDSEKRLRRYWKKIKAVLNEKDIARWSSVVNGHTAALNLRLSTLQSNSAFAINDQLSHISFDQRTMLETQENIWKAQTTSMSTVNDTLLELKKQTVLSASALQADEMTKMLQQLLTQVAGLSVQASSSPSPRLVEAETDSSLAQGVPPSRCTASQRQELTDRIKHLGSLISGKEGRIDRNHSRDIIDAMQSILVWMKSDQFLATVRGSAGRVSNLACSQQQLRDFHDRLDCIHSAIGCARQISLNDTSRAELPLAGTTSRSSWKDRRDYDTSIGTVSLITSEKWVKRPLTLQTGAPFHLGDSSDVDQEEVLTTMLQIAPKYLSAQQMTRLIITQYHSFHGTFTSIPRLCVNNIIPSNSPVFSIVQEGRVQDLQALLREGKASLRDHDENGRPLLFHALTHPEMCRYLIKNGADVDQVVSMASLTRPEVMAFAKYIVNGIPVRRLFPKKDPLIADHELGKREEGIMACYRVLLEAGCEPVSSITGNWLPILYAGKEHLNLLLYLLCCFIVTGTAMDQTRSWNLVTQFSHYSGLNRMLWIKPNLSVPIKLGANVRARDQTGKTCLHTCFQRLLWLNEASQDCMRNLRSKLVFLLQNGADIFARDLEGNTVSSIAYNYETRCAKGSWDLGSSVGDVCDPVLAECGFNASEFRRGYPRTATCTTAYAREMFESFWAGREHLYSDIEECEDED
ncbi:hypothetical protein QBC46DRAFT_447683 [Diplogelasinospora grovesii]|uniref:Azaphilone pigments biosynthesis cluster protein L N-terminal domain-containing protein n=1 Tax=Diplogelasinospora grovesii TaxID=303347 RepID=A0AAN6NC53_9PEZI|nr:hypothetical protein QBC46DRAFT_447683 [Diplogelasinospora grovesii]